MRLSTVSFLLGLLFGPSLALSIGAASLHHPSRFVLRSKSPLWRAAALRGGQQQDEADSTTAATASEETGERAEQAEPEVVAAKIVTDIEEKQTPKFSFSLEPMTAALASLGSAYGSSLEKRPIATKSVTACFIFAFSDWLAQRLEASKGKKDTNWTRTVTSALVGLLYFGPAAHFWYEMIFRILPETSLVSTLQKAALGQIFFGPSFTCIFFATSLLQQGTFSLKNWWKKIRTDLPAAVLAGIGFWPLVDLVSYSMIPKNWIPLFVNACSLVWTIYLSVLANREARRAV